jgi:hypothetical protein
MLFYARDSFRHPFPPYQLMRMNAIRHERWNRNNKGEEMDSSEASELADLALTDVQQVKFRSSAFRRHL